jgi:transcriptional regulator with XRE-family HTH domain
VDAAQQKQVKQRFGARLLALRKAKNMSQEELAFAADLDRSYLSAIERGKRNLSLVNIHRIAEALGVGAGALLGG